MLTQAYEPREYWLDRGRRYAKERDYKTPYFLEQEDILIRRVAEAMPQSMGELMRSTIIDIGCGFGRVTKRLAESFPCQNVTGIDLSPVQVENAYRYCQGLDLRCKSLDFMCADIMEIQPEADITVAMELFLHLPQDMLMALIPKIMAWSRVLIHDFDVFPVDNVSPHVFAHNYAQIYKSLGVRFQTWVGGSEPYGFITAYAS